MNSGDPRLTSKDLLDALHNKYPKAAIVHELVLTDTSVTGVPRGRGKRWAGGSGKGPRRRRIDAIMIQGPTITAIEVKVSRADYYRESDEKRLPFLRIAHRFAYLTPAGLLKPADIPPGIGLWECDEHGNIKSVVKCKINQEPEPWPWQLTKALAYRDMNAKRR